MFDRDLDLALRCSDLAGVLALDWFRRDPRPERKADGSVVTAADYAVEQLLRDELFRASPDDAVLAEETGSRGQSDRVWVLDPIDGTSSFVRGNPGWRVHVVLQVDGELVVAVITEPALGRQWWASRDRGAFESSWPDGRHAAQRLAVSTTESLDYAVLDGDNDQSRVRLASVAQVAPPKAEGWCGGLFDLVRGQVDCFLSEGHKFWDHAPWRLLVEEAGGRFTKQSDGELHGGGLYSNTHLHQDLLTALGYS